ncbi:YtzC family protein [Bacillus carboniphilus]|uniref:YtzC family protein n=1 Tax=Bacillus carboniphilus TaxID=86663 RepID=A0ABP3G392_9BACI
MATRQSMDDFLQRCEDALRTAQEEYLAGQRQEHYHDQEYTQAMQGLEDTINELQIMAHSANAQQRDQLYRMRLQIEQLQNRMILLDH